LSHINTYTSQFKDESIVRRACQFLDLPAPVRGTFRLYNTPVTGLGVQLRGWRFPLVINTDTGDTKYDNYGGSWGDAKELDAFKQRYPLEAAKQAAEAKNMQYREVVLDDGAIALDVVLVGGGGGSGGGRSPIGFD
jgi:hypothetical protein